MTREEKNFRRRLAYSLTRAMHAVIGVPASFDGCATFQARVHLAAVGIDPLRRWRGKYRTLLGLKRKLRGGGFRRACFEFMRRRCWPRIDARRARIGDLGLIKIEGGALGYALVRKLHRNEWVGRNTTAWSVVTTKDIIAAWRVSEL